ncbi:ABC transporter substrate-binding protein [Jeotgalibacillus marinus]|uniref:ABC transporter substrate-binding protein n=1 Tax=Jeotgalibacillus marinus TaxID=86667 RepID=A0ABV3Q2F5_9BACL
MKKKLAGFSSVFLASALILGACGGDEADNGGSSSNGDDKENVTIGVTQIVEHPSLDDAFEGFKEALEENGYIEGENVTFDEHNAANDMSANSTIATNLASSGVDLIFANSTPSAQSVLNATTDIPIVFTAVTDPVGAELVEALDKPGENITGTTDSHPDAISNTINFMIDELEADTIGVIYNAGEQNSTVQFEEVKRIAEEGGVKVEGASVSTSAEVKQAAESLLGRADAMYVPTDNTVVSALDSVIGVAEDNDIPLLVGELDSMERGGLAASGFNYFDLGYDTGLMAVDILNGDKTTAEIPVALPQSIELVINTQAAEKQGVEIKDEWSDMAEMFEGN